MKAVGSSMTGQVPLLARAGWPQEMLPRGGRVWASLLAWRWSPSPRQGCHRHPPLQPAPGMESLAGRAGSAVAHGGLVQLLREPCRVRPRGSASRDPLPPAVAMGTARRVPGAVMAELRALRLRRGPGALRALRGLSLRDNGLRRLPAELAALRGVRDRPVLPAAPGGAFG